MTKQTEDDKKDTKPQLYHVAVAGCSVCAWRHSEPAKDHADAHYGAARAAAERRATFHGISHQVRGY